ncbi:FecR domain-containing protein [Chitinophaga sp. 22321]|uniref:DUF4974 domain-containing protein n=1 Tax=Chitinophaga hostae TaxID=2831022 RepID=A0ABS5IXA2_9BACT|nr:FecR family protein [Chitinophaga hostae]MBS0027571.1 DUF4974 domain-containing protein [Chitinophaga hostae]
MDNNRIWVLLGKQASGDITPPELEELQNLLQQDPDAAATRTLIAKIWGIPLAPPEENADSHTRIWEHIAERIPPQRRPFLLRHMAAAAAAAVLLLGWCTWWYVHTGANSNLQQVSSPAAGKSKIVLPDGTQVWLNHNSQLVFHQQQFGRQNREVVLTGEAFFDVTHRAGLPFIIHAGKVNITVLGTTLNVKAYTKDHCVAATLISGKVAVNFQQLRLELKPDEKIIIPAAATTMIRENIRKDSTGQAPELSWLNNRLVFDNDSFEVLSKKMEQWYGVTFHFETSNLKHLHFSGVIDAEPITEALKALQLSRHFTYRISNNEVWISQ